MQNQLILIVIVFSFLIVFSYFTLIASYCYAWLKSKPPILNIGPHYTFVSIVIAARNEEENIENCITTVLNQSYPSQNFEIIIVDDNSEDGTNKKIQQFCNKYKNITLITLDKKSNLSGKKNAIYTAIQSAKGELIITTDADCIVQENWIQTIVSYYQQTDAKMIVAPVCLKNEKRIFEKMQSLEFMALIFSGGASLYFNKAIMCNGANLAYQKSIFNEVNGFKGIDNQPSGDDVLLMYKIKKKYPTGVLFLKHQNAIVYTNPQYKLNEFINQRKRWASKNTKLLNTETKLVSGIVYFANISLLILGIMCLFFYKIEVFHIKFYNFCFILFGIKCFIDFLLLFLATGFFNKKFFLIYFLPEQILYIVYISITGILGNIGSYEWKGRKQKINE